jgi:hypothetical protein
MTIKMTSTAQAESPCNVSSVCLAKALRAEIAGTRRLKLAQHYQRLMFRLVRKALNYLALTQARAWAASARGKDFN